MFLKINKSTKPQNVKSQKQLVNMMKTGISVQSSLRAGVDIACLQDCAANYYGQEPAYSNCKNSCK